MTDLPGMCSPLIRDGAAYSLAVEHFRRVGQAAYLDWMSTEYPRIDLQAEGSSSDG